VGVLAVDEVMLREPRLLVPGLIPVGPVRLADNAIAKKVTHAVLPGYFTYWANGAKGRTTVIDVSPIATVKGLAAAANSETGDYLSTPAFNRKRDVSVTLGVYGAPLAAGGRKDFYVQGSPSGPYTQLTFSINSDFSGNALGISIAAWYYEGGWGERLDSFSVDGNWNCWAANLPNNGTISPTMFCNGINKTNNASSSATVIDPSANDIKCNNSSTSPWGLFVTFSPMLTPAEAAAWTLDPFLIFDPA
jgi:hypothetical protein